VNNMKNKLSAYDIDGILTAGVKPKKPYVVISGRLNTDWGRTIEQLGPDVVKNSDGVYLRPFGEQGDRGMAGVWKGKMINMLGITEFHEDEKIQADIIRAMCPDCEVIEHEKT